jgi:hypothetical protein
MKLEARVMQHGVFYIHSLELLGSDLCIRFLGNPNESSIVRTLVFVEVQGYREEWYDRDDECIEMIMGIDEDLQEIGADYMLHTDQREMWFHSDKAPRLENVAPNCTPGFSA